MNIVKTRLHDINDFKFVSLLIRTLLIVEKEMILIKKIICDYFLLKLVLQKLELTQILEI